MEDYLDRTGLEEVIASRSAVPVIAFGITDETCAASSMHSGNITGWFNCSICCFGILNARGRILFFQIRRPVGIYPVGVQYPLAELLRSLAPYYYLHACIVLNDMVGTLILFKSLYNITHG